MNKRVPGKIGTSKLHWFGRGLLVGFMLIGALNAASYVFRSNSLTNLFSNELDYHAIGFPIKLWESPGGFSGEMVDLGAMGLNVLAGLGIGSIFGVFAMLNRNRLNEKVRQFEHDQVEEIRRNRQQFSIGGLMIATGLVAMLTAGISTWAGTKELLWFVYLLSPTAMILIAFAPRRISWQARCVILFLTAMVVIAGTVWSGLIRQMEFDQVLLGIFVFWTPQGTFAAIAIMGYLFFSDVSKRRNSDDSHAARELDLAN